MPVDPYLTKPSFNKTGKAESLDRAAAEVKQAESWETYKTEALKRGCQIDENGYIIGINAATGELEPEAQRTIKWAEIEEDGGKFYVQELPAELVKPDIDPVVEELITEGGGNV